MNICLCSCSCPCVVIIIIINVPKKLKEFGAEFHLWMKGIKRQTNSVRRG